MVVFLFEVADYAGLRRLFSGDMSVAHYDSGGMPEAGRFDNAEILQRSGATDIGPSSRQKRLR